MRKAAAKDMSMIMNETNGTPDEAQVLLERMVARFPMGCGCYRPVFNQEGKIKDFIIINVNEQLAHILNLPADTMIGKPVTDGFGMFGEQCIQRIINAAQEVYDNEDKTCETNISINGRVYKASFFFADKANLLCFAEDIHEIYFRRHYKRFIPHEIIASILAKNNTGAKERTALSTRQEPNSKMDLFKEPEPMTILQNTVNPDNAQDTAFRDLLTGLYDRCFAMEALRMYIDQNVLPLALVLGDVNGLKTINESLGYRTGDDILVKIANVLSSKCRADDIIARWNDGEFMLLLPYATQEDTQQIIKRLEAKLSSVCGEDYNIVTFGYATSDEECRTAEDLLAEAEKWIYRKKLLITQSHRNSIIRLLLSMLHAKSAETEEHSDRMAKHCCWIANQMKLSDKIIDDLILLSMLHDIGKIGIPDSILNKPGALTSEERKIINQHPAIGYKIARTVPELKQIADYILAHHERWDGTGYPNALQGEQIPMVNRIIAIVDAYDVMITGRVYRDARTKQEAMEELLRCAGTQFDPYITEIYVKLLTANVNAPESMLY